MYRNSAPLPYPDPEVRLRKSVWRLYLSRLHSSRLPATWLFSFCLSSSDFSSNLQSWRSAQTVQEVVSQTRSRTASLEEANVITVLSARSGTTLRDGLVKHQ